MSRHSVGRKLQVGRTKTTKARRLKVSTALVRLRLGKDAEKTVHNDTGAPDSPGTEVKEDGEKDLDLSTCEVCFNGAAEIASGRRK